MTTRVICRPPFSPWTCSACSVEFDDCAPPRSRMGLVCRECLEAGAGMGEPFIPLTIAPRKPRPRADTRPVVAVSMSEGKALVDRGEGEEPELIGLGELVARLRERPAGRPMTKASRDVEQLPPAIVVTDCGTDLLGYLNGCPELASSEFWQWKISLRDHSPWRPEAKAKSQRVFTRECVDLFGFASKRGDRRRAGGRSRYYQVLDPAHFSDAAGRMITGGYEGLEALLRFGRDVRDFCNAQGLRMASTAAGVASQLLRDQRFWPRWRRKMPAADNARARAQLPGNHYQLLVDELAGPADAHKMDMAAAHHTMAAGTRFPASDLMRAHGNFRHPPDAGATYDIEELSSLRRGLGREILEQHGMFCLALNVRRAAGHTFSLPAVRQPGRRWRYVFSTELPELLELERRRLIRIERIEAAWCSPEVDEGLNEYAWWAVDQLRRSSSYRRQWLKPALLAAYGLLAAKPRRHRNAWCWANSDQDIVIHTRHGDLFGVERATKRERESSTANVIWRCLIESALRSTVLKRARELELLGHQVVSLYADAIFTRGGVPPAPPPWRYEGIRHKLKFYGECHYASREEVRLPGIKRAELDRVGMFKRQMRDKRAKVAA